MSLVGAFDASGDEVSQLIIVVAGFVSSAKHWEEFSEQWVKRLKQDGLSCWHMKEYAHSTGAFAHLKGDKKKRHALESDLMDIIISNTYHKFGIVVTNETFGSAVSQATRDEWHLNAYSLAGRSCAKQINEWMSEEISFRSSGLSLVFEKGDAGAGKLRERLVEDGYQAPDFQPKRDRTTPQGVHDPAFIPLQAADWLAYEIFLDVNRMNQANRLYPQRWALTQFLERKFGEIGTYKIEDLRQFENMVELTKQMDEWAVGAGLLRRNEAGQLVREAKQLTCDLHLFSWSNMDKEGQPSLMPFCKTHKGSVVFTGKSGDNDIVVTCRHQGGEHPLNMCPNAEYEAEREEARALFQKHKESKAKAPS